LHCLDKSKYLLKHKRNRNKQENKNKQNERQVNFNEVKTSDTASPMLKPKRRINKKQGQTGKELKGMTT
jgi:hypothetical protein